MAASLLPGSRARWATSANSTRSAVQAAAVGHPPQRGADPQALPQLVEHPRPAQATGVDHLDLAGVSGGDRLLRVQEP